MNLIEQAQVVFKILERDKVSFALAGGLASSTYRKSKRFTEDLDFLFLFKDQSETKAREILEELGMDIREARKANLEGGPMHVIKRKSSPICILVGRKENSIGVDFILPAMPWFERAIERAQSNILSFGALRLPCLTIEDVLISKFYSLNNDSSRFKDADDIKEIFASDSGIDLPYLFSQMQKLKLTVPHSVEKIVPPTLAKASKKIRKQTINSSS